MSQNDRYSPAVVPPLSVRTLQHPSLMPLYMSAGFTLCRTPLDSDSVHAISPADIFYIDPTVPWPDGRRIPNTVCQFNVLDCFQLNTPPPIMSSCLAPPIRSDPFRSHPHAIRDLGGRTCRVPVPQPPPPLRTNPVVIQLNPEEDQAITNLLKLHHQEFSLSERVHPEKLWLEAELEAAHTLLSGFGPTEEEMQEKKEEEEDGGDLAALSICEEEIEVEEGGDLAAVPICEEEMQEEIEVEEGGDLAAVPICEEEKEQSALGCKMDVKFSHSEEDAAHVLLTFWNTAAVDTAP